VSSTQINLAWNDVPNETGFRIERSSGGGAFVEIDTVGAGVTSYSSGGLTASTVYSYRVRAFNASGNSGYSYIATTTTQSASNPPAAPAGFAADPSFFRNALLSIRMEWQDTSDETGYRIEKCKATSLNSGCTYSAFRTVGANTTAATDSSVFRERGIYKYRIRAENAAGVSAWSEITVIAQ
jgi:hypothetical protein